MHDRAFVPDTLDRAIVRILTSLPTTWTDHDAALRSSTDLEAIRLLERAGLIDRRAFMWVALKGHEDAVEATLITSGENPQPLVVQRMLFPAPQWLDEQRRLRGQLDGGVGDVHIRLSHLGETARHDEERRASHEPSLVLDYVRRRGFFALRPPVAPTVRVESCRVAPTANEWRSGARPSASMPTITVTNTVNVEAGPVVDAFLAELRRRQAANGAAPGKPPRAQTDGQPDPKRRRAKRTREDIASDELAIAQYLLKEPTATRKQVAAATGIAPAHISASQAWQSHQSGMTEAKQRARARARGMKGKKEHGGQVDPVEPDDTDDHDTD